LGPQCSSLLWWKLSGQQLRLFSFQGGAVIQLCCCQPGSNFAGGCVCISSSSSSSGQQLLLRVQLTLRLLRHPLPSISTTPCCCCILLLAGLLLVPTGPRLLGQSPLGQAIVICHVSIWPSLVLIHSLGQVLVLLRPCTLLLLLVLGLHTSLLLLLLLLCCLLLCGRGQGLCGPLPLLICSIQELILISSRRLVLLLLLMIVSVSRRC
jgi:hypothetical protein